MGYRAATAGGGWTVRPTGLVRRQRTFANVEQQVDREGALIQRTAEIGSGMDTQLLGGFLQFRYLDDRVLSGTTIFPRRRFGYIVRFNPSRRLAEVGVDGTIGEEVDFANARLGHGSSVNVTLSVNPTDHLELSAILNNRQLDVSPDGVPQQLFVARVSRLRGTYSFTARTFVRVIAQYVSTVNDPSLYAVHVDRRTGMLTGSALVAYKINWQSVLFLGYGDDREADDAHALAPLGRQVFVKISYAFQR